MPDLPVKRMILYKHGVGFFERYGQVGESARVELVFKKDEMNDVLKSLAAFPQGAGQVLNVSYETPEDKESSLAKAPIILSQNAALLDLLRSLRGRQVCLHLVEANITFQAGRVIESAIDNEFELSGTLLGIDAETELEKARVSILTTDSHSENPPKLRTYRLPQLRGVDVLDPQSGDDLRYVLELSRASGDKRTVTILLNQSDQGLLVSYIAPTPTWRVSYRLVYRANQPAEHETELPATGQLLLQGWGIVDNQLDEDLEDVELTLIAGQPISFVYDLYTPHLIQRPRVKDENRTVAAPVMFEATAGSVKRSSLDDLDEFDMVSFSKSSEELSGRGTLPPYAQAASLRGQGVNRDMEAATEVQVTGMARGELFQYDVSNPVSIKRGQSAMVPILSITLDGRKEHLYNPEKMREHPVVTIMATNATDLTLERGPVTVLENDNYVGEAVIAFTPAGGEFFVPYAVDLGVKITPAVTCYTEAAAIRLGKDDYLRHEEYGIQQTEYQIENRNPESLNLVIEQNIRIEHELFDTPTPFTQTAACYRWRVQVPARSRVDFPVKERQLTLRYESIRKLSHRALAKYLKEALIDQSFYDRVQAILDLYQEEHQNQQEIDQRNRRREQMATELQSAAEKLKPLGRDGSERALRKRYVDKMQAMEDASDRLAQEISNLETRNKALQKAVNERLRVLSATAASEESAE